MVAVLKVAAGLRPKTLPRNPAKTVFAPFSDGF
jgi:hypothetical protein